MVPVVDDEGSMTWVESIVARAVDYIFPEGFSLDQNDREQGEEIEREEQIRRERMFVDYGEIAREYVRCKMEAWTPYVPRRCQDVRKMALYDVWMLDASGQHT